ncbi:TetR family transcriptional regulator [Actinomycetaceae bacterium MB13-C1-2]|nr:TetR family transcriptional regulator [Actinomycetaceae bacterium MB13-C1-2]
MKAEDSPSLRLQQEQQVSPSGTEVPDGGKRSNDVSRGPSAKRGEVRDRIISVARQHFLSSGYDATTMSAIAKEAGCTPAMVTYYFESKQRLFRECLNLPIDPAQMVLGVLLEGREGAGERIARQSLALYEDSITADTMIALASALLTDAATSQRFRNYFRNDILGIVEKELGMDAELAEEIEFAMATMFGVATMRYIVRLEPIASMSRERLVRELAPIIQNRIDRAFARKQLRESRSRRS